MIRIKNYINGQWQDASEGAQATGYNPATQEDIYTMPMSQQADVDQAVEAAEQVQDQWAQTSPAKRFKILNAIAEGIEAQSEKLAEAETLDNGKPLWLSKKVDIRRAADNFRFFATAIMHYASDSHQMPHGAQNFTVRKPLGVVGCISPWNLPLYLLTWKIAPALATGNCVIAKPSEVTPLTAFYLTEICHQAGLPPGVLSMIFGDGAGAGASMVAHPGVKAISFTGSTRAGKQIASVASPMFKKVSLEMGGKNPNLIFADCDWDKMLQTTVQSSFANQGQICLCGSRILIEESVYDRFKKDFIQRIESMQVGDPLDPDTKVGAIVSREHYDKIIRYIDIAQKEGGQILTGGKAVKPEGRCAEGLFIQPTVIEGLGPECRTNQEEIFGPVVTLQRFSSDEQALSLANDSNYGLSASVWTSNLNRAMRISDKLHNGIVWVNCWLLRDLRTPFGGVKDSGVGREGGWYAMDFFTEPKNICIDYSDSKR